MKFNQYNRRHFLQGVGGFTLALPFMSSLWSTSAKAQSNFSAPKFLAVMASPHGCMDNQNWLPSRTPANEMQLYAGDPSTGMDHKIRYDRLVSLLTARRDEFNPNGNMELSPVLGAFLNPYLEQINLYAGLDITFYIAHHQGGYLGNFHGKADPNGSFMGLPPMETIDQIIAKSNHFYGANDPFISRTMNLSDHHWSISYVESNNSIVYANTMPTNAAEFFDVIFGTSTGGEQDAEGVRLHNLINRVYADYQRLANSPFGEGKRLSYLDRLRLEEHMTELSELEHRINNLYLTCEAVQRPSTDCYFRYDDRDLNRVRENWNAFFDIVMAAFRCGKSRIATMMLASYTNYTGDWHQNIAHQHFVSTAQRELIISNRFNAEHCFTRLVSKMDTDMGLGDNSTYLDHGLVVWNQESSYEAHKSYNMPTITAGSAGGFFNTGMYVDYRNISNLGLSGGRTDLPDRPGLPWNRWLYTMLRAMNIPASEFAREGMYGYGDSFREAYFVNRSHDSWPQRVINDCNTPLPLTTTGV